VAVEAAGAAIGARLPPLEVMAVLLDTSLPPPVDRAPVAWTFAWIFASSCSTVRPVPPG